MLTIIGIQSFPQKARGILQRKMLEVQTCVFVANIQSRQRDQLWRAITTLAEGDSIAYMVSQDRNESMGFKIVTFGESKRKILNFDGLLISRYTKKRVDKI